MKRITSFILFLLFISFSQPILADDGWVGTWATAVEPTTLKDMPAFSLANRSIRQVVHVSLGGSELRLQLSNVYSSVPVEIKSVFVADAKEGSEIDVRSARYLKFNGKQKCVIKAGDSIYSDVFSYPLKPLQRLAITICYGDSVPECGTSHRGSRTTSYIYNGTAKPKTRFVGTEDVDHWYNIAALDVKVDAPVVACLGNSITDGRGTTTNAQNRWTDFLAEGLDGKMGVLNLGIGGNCVLRNGLSDPAVIRFDRDILGQRGVKALIIFEGVNDIGGSIGNAEQVAQELIKVYGEMIDKAHAKGIKVLMGTITPFGKSFYDSRFHEAARLVVNDWIRDNKKADGFIDFDALVRDPQHPSQLIEAYSDDWLHLNPAGYEKMGKYAAEQIKKLLP
jgi:lysophospholipase L1-like esterase